MENEIFNQFKESLQIRGEARIVKTNIITGQVTEDRTESNIVTERALYRIFNHQKIGNSIGISSSQTVPDYYVSSVPNTYEFGYGRTEITNPIYVPPTDLYPEYGEWQLRFNPPSSGQRDIWTIYLTESESLSGGVGTANCYLKLASPCTQSDTEVLDIFYRVIFAPDYSSGVSNFGVTGLAKATILGDTSGVPTHPTFSWNANVGKKDYYNVNPNSSGVASYSDYIDGFNIAWNVPTDNFAINFSSVITYPFYFKRKFRWNIGRKWDNVSYPITGRIFGSVSVNSSNGDNSLGRAKILPDTFTKIQPLHYHRAGSTKPFQDVNNLAVGLGTIGVTGTWSNTSSWPEFYRINITKDGDQGISRYTFMKRKFLGFLDNLYTERFTCANFWKTDLQIENVHGLSNNNKTDIYSDKQTISWDDTGVTLLNHITGVHRTFDADSTIPLDVTSINQCATDSISGNGNIWVASPTEGLFKLVPATGNVTKQIFTDPFIDSDKCYGVYRGKNGSVWALMWGGFVKTTNGGSTWTAYGVSTNPQFLYPRITNNNWATVRYIKVNPDPNNPNEEICIVQDTSPLTWWTPSSGGIATDGQTFALSTNWTQFFVTTLTSLNNTILGVCVSETGGLWTMSGCVDGIGTGETIGLLPHSSTRQGNMTNSWPNEIGFKIATGSNSFLYDKSGNPLIWFWNQLTTRKMDEETRNKNRIFTPSNNSGNSYSDGDMAQHSFMFPGTNIACSGHKMLHCSDGTSDSGYGRELIWDEYGWNGTDWVKDYFGTDPVRNAGYLRLVRRNFDTATWDFDGKLTSFAIRNSIPYLQPTKNIKSILMTVASSQVADGGDKYLFEMNAGQRFGVLWHDANSPGQISFIQKDGVRKNIGLRPTNANDHRFVFSISEDDGVTVWKDGVLIARDIRVTGITDHKDFINLVLGSEAKMDTYLTKFSGRIKNLQLFDVPMGQDEVDEDFLQAIADTTYTIGNQGLQKLVRSEYVANTNMAYDEDQFTYTGATINVNDRYVKFLNKGKDSNDFDIQFQYSQIAVGTAPTNVLGGIYNYNVTMGNGASDAVNRVIAGFSISANGAAFFAVKNGAVVGASLGTWISSDVFRVKKTGANIEYYKNAVLLRTESYTTANIDINAGFSMSRGAAGTFTPVAMKLGYSYTTCIMGHWQLSENITTPGSKFTHVGSEPLLDGLNVSFANTVGEPINFFASDYFTFAGCNGFLKDNIRTLTGDYSFYYKPTEFDLTSVEPSTVSTSVNATVQLKTEGLWSSTTGLGSGLVSLLGNSTTLKGAFAPNHFLIEAEDLNYLSVTLNGVEAITKKVDLHSIGTSVTQSGGTINLNPNRAMAIPNNAVIWIQRNDNTWTQHTVNVNGGGTSQISFTPTISGGNPFKQYGHVVSPQSLVAGEVAIDPVFGIVRFSNLDNGKALTARYASLLS